MAQDYTTVAKFVWNNMLPILSNFVPNVNTPENTGKALARLVLDPQLDDTRKYFSGFKMIDSSQQSYDRFLAQQLWDSTVKLTQLKPQETILKLD